MISNKKELTDRYGYWPSFHDAEVLRAVYKSKVGEKSQLEIDLHIFEYTDKTDGKGNLKTTKNIIVSLCFEGVRIAKWQWSTDLDTLHEMCVSEISNSDEIERSLRVELPSVMGGDYGLSFVCQAITVVSVDDYQNCS